MKGGAEMNKYCINIEIPDGRVKEILKELDEAQEKIRKCYEELCYLGVLTIKKAPSGQDDAEED